MYIESVSIENYKSFWSRQTLQFEPGFNLLLGANNAGKTTVFDVIDLGNLNEPHRSELTIPAFGGQTTQMSETEVTLVTRFNELRKLVGPTQLYLPITHPNTGLDSQQVTDRILQLIDRDGVLKLVSKFSNNIETVDLVVDDLIRGVSTRERQYLLAAFVQFLPKELLPKIEITNSEVSGLVCNYVQKFKPKIYRFNALRRPGHHCAQQESPVLDREAASLPYCINHLHTNDSHGHKTLCELINRVFPSVKWVQAPPTGSGFELKCLPTLPSARRDDLAIPMGRMGQGIGNIIAMLYVVLTSREPQVIAIDEPNSFLHPRALKELLAILEAEGKQHQFILTAHSADVLTAVNAKTISVLEFDGVATTAKQVGSKDFHALRGSLADLGIRMTDLHAKDRVFWVEGQSEELVMPALLRWACPEVAAGTSVLRVEDTNTFAKKKVAPEEIVKIYERLSTASAAFVPPMVCILLDSESRTPKQREDIEASSRGKLRFLDRRMLENHLLHPQAIADALKELGQATASEAVHAALCKHFVLTALPGNLVEVDGAAALKAVFSDLSNATQEFRKTRDVPTIVNWLIENDPNHLLALRQCLRNSFNLPV